MTILQKSKPYAGTVNPSNYEALLPLHIKILAHVLFFDGEPNLARYFYQPSADLPTYLPTVPSYLLLHDKYFRLP